MAASSPTFVELVNVGARLIEMVLGKGSTELEELLAVTNAVHEADAPCQLVVQYI